MNEESRTPVKRLLSKPTADNGEVMIVVLLMKENGSYI